MSADTQAAVARLREVAHLVEPNVDGTDLALLLAERDGLAAEVEMARTSLAVAQRRTLALAVAVDAVEEVLGSRYMLCEDGVVRVPTADVRAALAPVRDVAL